MNNLTIKNGKAMTEQTFIGIQFKYGKKMKSRVLSTFLLFLAGLSTVFSIEAAELKSVDFSALPGDKAKIQLMFSDPVSEPHSFATDDPARIVLDFAGVKNKLEQRTQQVNIGVTRSISTVEAGDRTRMVINLLQKAPFSIEQSGNQVTLTINNASSVVAQKRSGSAVNSVTDIDFRRGEQGEARLIVKFDNQNPSLDVREERGNLLIDVMGTTLPDKLQRRLDVMDFATPVKFIDSENRGNNARLTLTTEGQYEHLAYQSDNTLIVEVKPMSEKEKTAGQQDQFGYKGDKLSLNFQNIEVRAVLQLLADFTGMNLVTSDTVKGNLTLRLKNVPWDQALDIILKTKGLAMRQNGNVMLVAPAAEIAAREKQELEAKQQLIELEPLYTEIIEIKFAKADELAQLLRTDNKNQSGDGTSGFLSSRGSITIDQRTNSLLIRDTADNLADIQNVIEDLDKPVRQVLIESRIVIANNDFSKELGVRFGATKDNTSGSKYFTEGITTGSLEGMKQLINNESLEVNDSLNVDLPVVNAAGSIALALAKLPFGTLLELELSAMQAEGKGEIISTPRVITSNQKQATIEQGTEIPYQEASSSGATSVSFKEALLKLDVTPQITPDDRIVMDLEVSKDAVGEIFANVPSIDTRSVKTQVLVDNGETVVLGGIYEQSKTDNVERVPFFSDLPYVGFMFRNTAKEDTRRELLVFVTPKIVKDELNY